MPTISCLTVTRTSRLPGLELAIGDYARQTHAERELVIVHDGGGEFDRAIAGIVAQHRAPQVRSRSVAAGQTLGALRNCAVDAAEGALVCQWDDDDRYHPERLDVQARALATAAADFAFLTDQLHWFPRSQRMTWDDWRGEAHPLDFVQGTLMGRRAAMPRYEPLARGEDTALCARIVASGNRIERIDNAGWGYIYVCHGDNAWSDAHHWAIAHAKAMPPARLLARAPILAQRLQEYAPPPGRPEVDPAGRFIRIS
jgi:glycosyltransferase involved in cell wall biosynthesis